jgi:hypothetical protein
MEISGIRVEVVRKAIKNLHIGVYPPNGRVRVAVPARMSDDAVRLAVVGKLAWIKRHQIRFANQERQSPREYVTGETHFFKGKCYRLNVVHQDGPAKVAISRNGIIDLHLPADSDAAWRERVLYEWYRCRLKEQIPELLAKWEEIVGVQSAEWGVKRMKTRWGTCNIKARRIWINLELIKKPIHCLEYIIVHELVHLLEQRHNDRFAAFMDRFMPLWKQYRQELNQAPLVHGEWEY